MPLQKIQLRPGVSRESTDLANEGGWYACEKIRFRSGMPENLGGWTVVTPSTFLGMCRNLVEWETLADPVSFLLLGIGTNLKYYLLNNQTLYDITPLEVITEEDVSTQIPNNPIYPIYSTLAANISASDTTITVASGTSFAYAYPLVVRIGSEDIYVETVSGTTLSGCSRGYNGTTAAVHTTGDPVSSSWVAVNSPVNGTAVGNFVSYVGATAFGPYATTDLNKNFQVKAQSANYVIVDTGIQSTSATNGGGTNIVGYYEIDVGADSSSFGQGWGAGLWYSLITTGSGSALTADINDSATTINVASTAAFSASGYILLESELIQYSGKTGTSFTGCTRSTTNPTAHMMGAVAYQAVYPVPASSPLFGGHAWNTPAEEGVNIPARIWSADNFGQDLVLNIRDNAVFYWAKTTNMQPSGATTALPTVAPWYPNGHAISMDSVTFGADAWAPSVASRVLVSEQRHIVVLGTNDPLAVSPAAQDPMLVRWCEQEDPLTWEPTQTNTAGFQRLSYGSKLITAEKTREEILIWSDSALYSMRYLGPPYTFGFNTLSNEVTVAGPNAVITSNNITYWMGLDKFYVYSGRVDTLPCSLRQYIFDDINNQQLDQIYAGTSEKYNEVWWFYCSAGSNQVDRYVIYNYLEKLWYYGQLTRSAWYDSHIRTYPVAAAPKVASFSVTEVTDTGGITAVSLNQAGDYETVPSNPNIAVGGTGAGAELYVTYSARAAISAVVSQGGKGYGVGDVLSVTGGIPTGNITLQDYGVDDATDPSNPIPISSYIESADFDIGDGDQFAFVRRLIPDVDFIGSPATLPTATMTVSARNYPGQGLYISNDAAIVASTSKVSVQIYDYTPDFWIRLRGRQVAFRIGSNTLGVKWQLGVPRLDITPDGRR